MTRFIVSLICLWTLITGLLLASGPTNTTITISSATYTTITSEYEPREVYIGDPICNVPIYYKIDGSTTNITTEGWWIPEGQGQKIEYKDVIYLQLGAGKDDVTVRKMIIR